MICWRLCKRQWARTAFSGAGAAEYPGRWNSGGTRIVYCAETLSLAALELLVHVADKSYLSRARFSAFEVRVPDPLVQSLPRLPSGWDRTPGPATARQVGDRFVSDGKAPVLCVPSAVVRSESIFLLNPAHQDFGRIEWKNPISFSFDPRLLP